MALTKEYIFNCEKEIDELEETLKYYKNKASRLKQENKKLQNNWNTLKTWLKCNDLNSLKEYYTDGIETILNKIEELEKE